MRIPNLLKHSFWHIHISVLNLSQHCPRICRSYRRGITAQPATLHSFFWRCHFLKTLRDLLRTQIHIQPIFDQVNIDHIPIDECCNRAACRCFWRNMADTCSTRATRETSIGDQRNFLTKTHTYNVGCRCQHLLHTWATSRTFIANYNNIACLYLSIQNTRAGPQWCIIEGETAPTFTTAPSGARLPKSNAKPPRSLCGASIVRITSWSLISA